MTLEERLDKALNKLAKWRTIFASWQLGTRLANDPECKAVKDHREVTILMRAEINAISALLLEKKIFTQEEFQRQLLEDVQYLDKSYEEKFPGISTTDIGTKITEEGMKLMQSWPK